ncbi:MAG TPA: GGDEF domain-containing protein [Candidatus Limnocylindria bacterium]|nr:GGDEF domain-containing protein [Candidatus Limnocylindria bacterium]
MAPAAGVRTVAAVSVSSRIAPRPRRGDDVDDVLVFEHRDRGFALIGGHGRGAGWAGIVELDEPSAGLVGRAWGGGTIVHAAGARPVQVAGPYYARHAAAIPVGQRHVVVLGGRAPLAMRDTDLVRFAAEMVDAFQGVPIDKLLADELELVQALRSLMAYRPENVRDTLRHIATVACQALSCEVALIGVEHEGDTLLEGINVDGSPPAAIGDEIDRLLARHAFASGPRVEQAASVTTMCGVEVVSTLTLPLGAARALGALALGHAAARPRGFTSLCQRIGRAMAEASELLITQAVARERLAAERDLLARVSGTDALTGVGNRRTWDEASLAVLASPDPVQAYVVSVDLDGLKQTNDRYGHAAGDALIRGAANLLKSSVRETDLVARVGGDEFLVLLRPADANTARRVARRIRRAEQAWRVTQHSLTPRVSLGLARVPGNDVEAAHRAADRRMYANKRRRAAAASAAKRPAREMRRRAAQRPAARGSQRVSTASEGLTEPAIASQRTSLKF